MNKEDFMRNFAITVVGLLLVVLVVTGTVITMQEATVVLLVTVPSNRNGRGIVPRRTMNILVVAMAAMGDVVEFPLVQLHPVKMEL